MHALNNVGAAEMHQGLDGGRAKLERSLAMALEAGLEEHVARAYTNLGAGHVERREYAIGDPNLDAGIAYCAEHDLDAWLSYMTGWRARSELDHGRWDDAAATATLVLARSVAAPSRITPLTVVGRLRARRGDPDPWSPLDEARELAGRTGELQRLAPVAGARAEARWLAGDTAEIADETAATLALALELRDGLVLGELYLWRRRAGIVDEIDLDAVAEPYRLELEGEYEAAGDRWAAIGCPYEAALARGHAGDAGRSAARARRAPGPRRAAGRRPRRPRPAPTRACATCGGARTRRRARTRRA